MIAIQEDILQSWWQLLSQQERLCPGCHCKIFVDDISGCISMSDASSNNKIFNPTLGSYQAVWNEKPCKQQQIVLKSG
jgi:hypothetical protein